VVNRRAFLSVGFQAAAGVCLSKSLAARPLTTRRLTTLGVQLYMVRRELEKDFDGTLARIAALGIKQVEFTNYFNHPAREVKIVLDRYHLTAPSTHVQLPRIRNGFQQLIETCHVLGHKYILFAWMPPEERKNLDDYKRLADLFNKTAEQLKKENITFGYHNHDFEFQPMEGQLPYDVLLDRTDPQTVKLELDLYWIVKGGGDPLKYFQKYPGRYHLLHVKDMDATPKRDFTEVGRGVIDFQTIFKQAPKAGVKYYFIEQDETPGSPFDSLKISVDYLKQLEF
jgi:sugar phosphate isomerase/epimerase